jgi:hypothetical protein
LLAAGMLMGGELERAASGAGLVARVERGGGTRCRRVVLLEGVHRDRCGLS